jgi:predicted ArsR family transcriptional regulator
MNTAEQTLFLLKTRGPQTAQQLAALLELTSMGARRQLETWQEKGMVAYEDVADKPGRPARRWLLTEAGHARFPDRHADLTLQLIDQVRALFGDAGLDKLIGSREAASELQYRRHLSSAQTLPQRVAALVQARSAEGYMAELEARDDGSLLLIENHCDLRRRQTVPAILPLGAGGVPARTGAGLRGRARRAHVERRAPLRLPHQADLIHADSF